MVEYSPIWAVKGSAPAGSFQGLGAGPRGDRAKAPKLALTFCLCFPAEWPYVRPNTAALSASVWGLKPQALNPNRKWFVWAVAFGIFTAGGLRELPVSPQTLV